MDSTKFPLVSIIVTTKNEGENIASLLESVKNQTYRNYEIIIVDNGSSDATKQISKKYTKKVYDFGPERSAQRNHGAKIAHGSYLIFFDADMELTPRVIEDCVGTTLSSGVKALVIPERTVGEGFIPTIRRFEREMYMDDPTIELARFFNKKVFFEFGGYDLSLTGPEDYDLSYRISKKYGIGRIKEYILHHEEGLTLSKLLKKRYYYASKGALYASKHPELIASQGTIIFRKAYLRHWRRFVQHPLLGISFLIVRILETIWAITGYISAVGILDFFKTLPKVFKP